MTKPNNESDITATTKLKYSLTWHHTHIQEHSQLRHTKTKVARHQNKVPVHTRIPLLFWRDFPTTAEQIDKRSNPHLIFADFRISPSLDCRITWCRRWGFDKHPTVFLIQVQYTALWGRRLIKRPMPGYLIHKYWLVASLPTSSRFIPVSIYFLYTNTQEFKFQTICKIF